jgi:hypothetical protein
MNYKSYLNNNKKIVIQFLQKGKINGIFYSQLQLIMLEMFRLLQLILKTYFQIIIIIINFNFSKHISLLCFHRNFIYLLIYKKKSKIKN